MCVTVELKPLQVVNVNIFCINSFHTAPLLLGGWVRESMVGSILFTLEETHSEKVLGLVQGQTSSRALAGSKVLLFHWLASTCF